ncbi:hypothetical protein CLOBY_00950 [Clostridium saccharobutylicum]|uniref:YhfM-like domain-containing protein n=2 Tax=Clostridium saccharobutylicum TaxID=169679 RepID=U5MK13_CLOSA|nr:hypothetical protein [Clostridium saccharobutylicum]AGX41154.1 hypothetical protein CLSA_c00810 [Clostridium saccharobutylicum DSM 13864]AQR88439.1 hypothetical protein CLOSC_00800 [Clostridium saccharobutylicum]AQR98337.1 hypothetical protein CSACC_00800 [Clostridium saccharobutylicum]AQS08046.1 hypothetical protein CLOBY_00950 [Clostridium saccharobutylicum]AQS12327.1 hypothetical protein CLOSACC_00800 [Clostridium saccharobutylicum]
MKKSRFFIMILSVLLIITTLSGCTLLDSAEVKLNIKNQYFDYMSQNKVDKIIIQNVRDSGFRFIINDSKAIDDVYKLLSKGSEVSKKSSLDPDYIFEVWIGDEVKKYQYVVGANESGTGNFYDDDKAFSVSKNLENTIMQNLSVIRKPRDFEYVYYQSILKVINNKKDSISSGKVGVDISNDTDCLKYMFSIDLQEFKKNLNKILPNVDLVKNNSEQFDTVIKVKNRGFNTTTFKTLITVENKSDKSLENYYISAEYNYKDWDITVSEPNQMPQDW